MILVNGYIKNSSGQPIPFASVQILDGFFEYTGEGVAANASGFFTLYVNEDHEPYMLSASSVGYKPAGVKLNTWLNGSVITLAQDVKTNENVIVYSTPRPPAKKPFPAWLAFIPLLAVIADQKNGGRKVSGIKSFYEGLPPWARGVVGVAGGFVAYTTLSKILRKKSGTQTVHDASTDLDQLQQGTTTTPPIRPTYTDTQYNAWAEQITKQFAGCDPTYYFPDGFSYSGRLINNIFKQLANSVDFLKLVTIYGVRKYDQCGVWPISSDFEGSLFAAIEDELTEGERSRLTATLKSNGITYKV